LSTKFNVASAGTEIVAAKAKEVPVPPAFVFQSTVTSAAFVPSTFAIMIDSILKTFPDDDALASNTVVRVVVNAIPVVLPNIEFTDTIFGFAIFYLLVNYYPKTKVNAIDFPAVIPLLAWKDGVEVDPFEVNIKPAVVLEIAPKVPLLLN
jgi:hypothetical protein